LYNEGKVGQPGTAWRREDVFSYSLFLANEANNRSKRNRGVLKPVYINNEIEILPNLQEDMCMHGQISNSYFCSRRASGFLLSPLTLNEVID
jgi:hypothetical protein